MVSSGETLLVRGRARIHAPVYLLFPFYKWENWGSEKFDFNLTHNQSVAKPGFRVYPLASIPLPFTTLLGFKKEMDAQILSSISSTLRWWWNSLLVTGSERCLFASLMLRIVLHMVHIQWRIIGGKSSNWRYLGSRSSGSGGWVLGIAGSPMWLGNLSRKEPLLWGLGPLWPGYQEAQWVELWALHWQTWFQIPVLPAFQLHDLRRDLGPFFFLAFY